MSRVIHGRDQLPAGLPSGFPSMDVSGVDLTAVAIGSADEDAVRCLLAECCGLVIEDARRDVLLEAMRVRMATVGQSEAALYVEGLRADAAELGELVEHLVVPETYFFRSPPQLRALDTVVLPDLVERARSRGRKLRIWSAGCSSGEEAYTLAMILTRLVPDRSGWDLKVLGTDISLNALAAARQGCYGARSVAPVEHDDLHRFFTPLGASWRVGEQLRDLVDWRQHNLVSGCEPFRPGTVDLVVCRNVTIYFGRDTVRGVIDSFHRCLAPEGWLLLGPSETLWRLHDGFHAVRCDDVFVYRRREVPPVVTRDAPGPTSDRYRTEQPPPLPRPSRAPRRTGDRGAAPAPPPGRGKARITRPSVDRLPAPGAASGAGAPLLSAPLRSSRAQQRAARMAGAAATRAALSTGAYEAAVSLARAEAKRHPLSGEAHYLEGLALVNLGRHEEALSALRRAVYTDPGHGFAQFLLAVTLSGRGAAGEAARAYGAAADALDALDPDVSAPELDGRRVSELAALCRLLARSPASRRGGEGSPGPGEVRADQT